MLLGRRGNDLEGAGQEAFATRVAALDLTARSLEHTERARTRRTAWTSELVLLGDGPADRADDLGELLSFPLAFDFRDDHQAFFALELDGKRGGRFLPERRVASLDGPLEILGVDVSSPDDDHVLDSPGDEQLPIEQKPEVAGAEEWSGAARCGGVERGLRLFQRPQ